MRGRGCIVLNNVLKTRLAIDGTAVKLEGGFRGFDAVPPGRHEIIWEPDSPKALSIDLNLLPNEAIVCQMQYYTECTPVRWVKLDPPESTRSSQLALSGSMGFALQTYPSALKTIENRAILDDIVEEIFGRNRRLYFVLSEEYGLSGDGIQSLKVAPNRVEFCTEERNFAFKLCPYLGDRFMLYVFVPSPQYPGCYDRKLDPALWSALYELIDDYGDFD